MVSESLMTQEERNAFLNAATLPDDGFKNYIKGELEKLITRQERDLMILKRLSKMIEDVTDDIKS